MPNWSNSHRDPIVTPVPEDIGLDGAISQHTPSGPIITPAPVDAVAAEVLEDSPAQQAPAPTPAAELDAQAHEATSPLENVQIEPSVLQPPQPAIKRRPRRSAVLPRQHDAESDTETSSI
jgi:hypothetical protein